MGMRDQANSQGLIWEILAPIIGWPLWSPKRFFGSLAAVLVVVMLGSSLTSGGENDQAGSTSDSAQTNDGSTNGDGAGATKESLAPGVSANEPTSAVAIAAVEFVKAHARGPELDREAWLAELKPLVTPAYLKELGKQDPSAASDAGVVGSGLYFQDDTQSRVLVQTDDETVQVIYLSRPSSISGDWLVRAVRQRPAS